MYSITYNNYLSNLKLTDVIAYRTILHARSQLHRNKYTQRPHVTSTPHIPHLNLIFDQRVNCCSFIETVQGSSQRWFFPPTVVCEHLIPNNLNICLVFGPQFLLHH